MNILVLLWHPAFTNALAAGGYVRTKEVLERFPSGTRFYVVDSYSAFFSFPKSFFYIYFPPHCSSSNKVLSVFCKFFEIFCSFFSLLHRAIKIIRTERIDVVYVPTSEILWITLAAFLLKKFFRIRTVGCNQNVEGKNTIIRFIQWWNIRFHNWCYDDLITVSEMLRTALIKRGIKHSIYVHTNGLSQIHCGHYPIEKKNYAAIFVGRHEEEKGIFDILDIWKEVVLKNNDAILLLVGFAKYSVLRTLHSEIEKRHLGKNIIIKGQVSEKEKVRLMQESKVFLFPSHVEGWGLAPQEALQCGLPVVAYHLPAYDENIVSCEAAFLASPFLVSQMTDYVNMLLSNNTFQRFVAVGPKFVQRFSWEETAKKEYRVLSK